jgi:hypothetical protein
LCGKRRREIKAEILENNYTKPDEDFEMSEDRLSTMKDENSTLIKSDPSKIPCLTDKKAIEWYLKYDEDKFIQFE